MLPIPRLVREFHEGTLVTQCDDRGTDLAQPHPCSRRSYRPGLLIEIDLVAAEVVKHHPCSVWHRDRLSLELNTALLHLLIVALAVVGADAEERLSRCLPPDQCLLFIKGRCQALARPSANATSAD